jgi:dihydrofolate synthase / folylpolyglutamate synthase
MIADTLDRLSKLHPKLIDLSLDRMIGLLAKFGNPHLSLPPTFHVAGTNGKGSTCAHLRSFLEAAGKSVHVYSSPHLVKFNERFRVNGKLIDDARLADVLEEVERVNGNSPITQFEITTIAGFLLFSSNPADYLILEVGLGGRLDATNVIERPLCSIITPISIDHQDYLGETLALIAAEKAGIIKRNTPVIIAPQGPEVVKVLENASRRAKPFIAGQDFHIKSEHGRLIYQDEAGLLDLPPSALHGDHQFVNAGVAIAALRRVGIDVPYEKGLKNVTWAARMQHLGNDIWLDGGHNEAGGRVLSQALSQMSPKPLTMILGMINTKNPRDFLVHFKALNPHIYCIPFDYPAALSPDITHKAALEFGFTSEIAPSFQTAMQKTHNRVIICGSLYLAGEVLRELNVEIK